jgi:aryl-alcohol dehydrogenase-like predicted oxidoreductase
LAKAFKGRRDQVIIATKFGSVFDETSRQVTGQDASQDYILRACQASLKRLGTDYIDLLQFHTGAYPPDKALIVRETLEDLVSKGLIRAYGWSTDNPDLARIFGGGQHCTSAQFQMNVMYWMIRQVWFLSVKKWIWGGSTGDRWLWVCSPASTNQILSWQPMMSGENIVLVG